MNTAHRNSVLLLSVLGSAALASSHAGAQPKRPPVVTERPLAQGPRPAPVLRTNIVNLSTEVTGGGTVTVGTNGSLAGIPILNGFHFRFLNGDHKLDRIGLRPTGDQAAYVTFRDKNADDRYKAAATWLTLNGGGVRGEISAFSNGPGMSFVKLPTPRPPNSRLVLTGFELRRFFEVNVRVIGIWLDEATNTARVSFAGGDYAERLGPDGPTATGTGRGANPLPSPDLDKLPYLDGFGVRLQYAWIPNEAVAGEKLLTGNQRSPDSGVAFPARSGIQGFEFRYDSGGDHHLKEIGVLPPLPGAATRTASGVPANESVAFQDKNRDDAIKWAVKVLDIK